MQGTRCAAAVAVATVLQLSGCSRTIEEDEPPVLVEHRIEPCRQWCAPMLSAECGRVDEPRPYATVDECVEDCAAAEPGGWEWARQEDGTDACAEEWFAIADCMESLTCEEHRSFFRRDIAAYPPGYPCTDELEAKIDCFYSTPSLEREGDDR